MAKKRKDYGAGTRSSSRSKARKLKADLEPDSSLMTPQPQEAGTRSMQPPETLKENSSPLCNDAQHECCKPPTDKPDNLQDLPTLPLTAVLIRYRQEDAADVDREEALATSTIDTTSSPVEFSTSVHHPKAADNPLISKGYPSDSIKEENGHLPVHSTPKMSGDWTVEERVMQHEPPADKPDGLQASPPLPLTAELIPCRQGEPRHTDGTYSSALLGTSVIKTDCSPVEKVGAEYTSWDISVRHFDLSTSDLQTQITDHLMTTTSGPAERYRHLPEAPICKISRVWSVEGFIRGNKSEDGRDISQDPKVPYMSPSMGEKDGSQLEKEPKSDLTEDESLQSYRPTDHTPSTTNAPFLSTDPQDGTLNISTMPYMSRKDIQNDTMTHASIVTAEVPLGDTTFMTSAPHLSTDDPEDDSLNISTIPCISRKDIQNDNLTMTNASIISEDFTMGDTTFMTTAPHLSTEYLEDGILNISTIPCISRKDIQNDTHTMRHSAIISEDVTMCDTTFMRTAPHLSTEDPQDGTLNISIIPCISGKEKQNDTIAMTHASIDATMGDTTFLTTAPHLSTEDPEDGTLNISTIPCISRKHIQNDTLTMTHASIITEDVTMGDTTLMTTAPHLSTEDPENGILKISAETLTMTPIIPAEETLGDDTPDLSTGNPRGVTPSNIIPPRISAEDPKNDILSIRNAPCLSAKEPQNDTLDMANAPCLSTGKLQDDVLTMTNAQQHSSEDPQKGTLTMTNVPCLLTEDPQKETLTMTNAPCLLTEDLQADTLAMTNAQHCSGEDGPKNTLTMTNAHHLLTENLQDESLTMKNAHHGSAEDPKNDTLTMTNAHHLSAEDPKNDTLTMTNAHHLSAEDPKNDTLTITNAQHLSSQDPQKGNVSMTNDPHVSSPDSQNDSILMRNAPYKLVMDPQNYPLTMANAPYLSSIDPQDDTLTMSNAPDYVKNYTSSMANALCILKDGPSMTNALLLPTEDPQNDALTNAPDYAKNYTSSMANSLCILKDGPSMTNALHIPTEDPQNDAMTNAPCLLREDPQTHAAAQDIFQLESSALPITNKTDPHPSRGILSQKTGTEPRREASELDDSQLLGALEESLTQMPEKVSDLITCPGIGSAVNGPPISPEDISTVTTPAVISPVIGPPTSPSVRAAAIPSNGPRVDPGSSIESICTVEGSEVASTSDSHKRFQNLDLCSALSGDATSVLMSSRQGECRGEDASSTVRGLILELSNLNRLIMNTYRDLRQKRLRHLQGRGPAGAGKRRRDI